MHVHLYQIKNEIHHTLYFVILYSLISCHPHPLEIDCFTVLFISFLFKSKMYDFQENTFKSNIRKLFPLIVFSK